MGTGHVKGAKEAMLAVLDLIEANSQIAQRDGDGVTLRDELNGIDDARAGDAWLLLHLDSVIDPYYSHVGLKQDHLVDFLEVVDLLDLAVVRCPIDNVS